MKNKFLLSVAASALLTTSAFGFGGNLSLNGGGDAITVEYDQLHPNDNTGLSLDRIQYFAKISNPSSVSDAALEFDFSDTNLTSSNLENTFIVKVDENGSFVSNGGVAVLSFAQLTSEGIASYKKLNDDTGIINTEEYYSIRGDINGNDSNITYSLEKDDKKIKVTTYSTSGSPTAQDTAEKMLEEGTTSPQFKFSCFGKFDGLINIENASKTFVATGHGDDNQSMNDTLIFTIDNKDGTAQKSVDGNGTEIILSTDVNLSSLGFAETDFTLSGKQGSNTYPGTMKFIPGTNELNLTITDAIPTGLSTWYANIALSGTSSPKDTVFTMKEINLEGNSSVHPAIKYETNMDAGKWKNYAFISQIPAGESGGAANMSTRYFITNRSCKAVTPIIDVVYNGHVYSATNVAELPIDTQKVYTLKDIMLSIPELATVWNANTSTKVSVEITLPGIAEDFYVYAQVKNKSINQFKDLPVYNTSSRN